ncbi:uncharacterized protein CCR75_000124 [Bremia lactucae]|uniref:Chromo domain-containing protein n=1 Tax=Bremia lactucae TaxID=4779 RepID=A0A976IHQ6_BRELC|nr:hypothetical protein CCR75_000124 [Bremia lactucae]
MVSRTEKKADGPRTRGSRKSAVRASALIAGHLASKAPAKRKRLVRHVESSDESEEEEEPFDELCEIERLVKREDREGKRWYLVKWLVDTSDGKLTWLPEEALGGAAEWKRAVDRYYDEALPKDPSLTIQQWLRRYATMITMGDNAWATCVYEAVRVVLRLQGTPFELTEELIQQFEEKEAMCQGGLRTDTVQKLFEFLIRKRKWQVELKPNVFGKAGQLTGPAGILMAVNLKPGVYVVATLDSLYRGRCIVVKVGHDKMAFAYEDGLRMGLGEYLYAKTICWIRECVDTVGGGVRILDEGGPGEIAFKLVKAPLARRQAKPRRRKRARNASRTGLVEVADETG